MTKRTHLCPTQGWFLSFAAAHTNPLLLNPGRGALETELADCTCLLFPPRSRGQELATRAAASQYCGSLMPQVWGGPAGHGHASDPRDGLHHLSSSPLPKALGKRQISPPTLVLLSSFLSHKYFCHTILISGERKLYPS